MEAAARLIGQAIPRSTQSSVRRSTRSICSSSIFRSHIGSEPILIPDSVTCKLDNTQPQRVQVSGKRGVSSVVLPAGIAAQLRPTNGRTPDAPLFALEVSCQDTGSTKFRSNWGLARTKLNNIIVGLTDGFSLPVKLVGVGYRATLEAVADLHADGPSSSPASSPPDERQILILRLGYPRPIRLPVPPGIACEISSPTDLLLKGSDREEIGGFAASIRRWRPPEPYNGKGVFVGSEQIRRKEVRKK